MKSARRITEKHDGVSPITIRFAESKEEAQFQRLWHYLVPKKGRAQTAQGEIIRIADCLCCAAQWDEDHKKMLRVFPQYLELGNALEPDRIEDIRKLIEYTISMADCGFCGGITGDLRGLALTWVKQNPDVIAPLKADYKH